MLRNSLLLYAQVISDERTDIVLRADLDFIPIFLIVVLLFLRRQSHENKISDFITLAQIQSGGIKALKNQLRIVLHIQPDVDNLQAANGIVKLINGDFLLLNPVVEIIVIYGQIGLPDVL